MHEQPVSRKSGLADAWGAHWHNSVHERALSATGLSYARRHLADTVLLTPTKTHDESMGTCTGRTAPPPHRHLRWSLTPVAHHLVRALPLASTMALRFP
jgi:hypothetical protein